MILIAGCTSSEITPSPTEDEPSPEDIGISSFFFSVNPITIVQGDCAVVRWAVEPEGEWPVVFNNEVVEHVDQREVCPERTAEYELWADPPGPDIQEEIITLEVVQLGSGDVSYEGEGEILDLRAEPERIQRGECTELTWEALAPPDLYFILNGEPVPPAGARQVCPVVDTVYELMLLEPSEAVYAHIDVYVDQGAGPSATSTLGSAPPAGEATATPETKPTGEPTSTATSTPGVATNTPQPQGPGVPTATRTPTATAIPTSTPTSAVSVATLIWPTPTPTLQPIPFPEIYLQIVDIFLVTFPIGEVNVRIRNSGPYQVETPPNYNIWLTCSTTIYSSTHPPVAYSGQIKPDVRLDPGGIGVYPGFYQGAGIDSSLDFTNGWGDVTCYLTLTFDNTDYAHFTERLP
jgi:hypothetical protein